MHYCVEEAEGAEKPHDKATGPQPPASSPPLHPAHGSQAALNRIAHTEANFDDRLALGARALLLILGVDEEGGSLAVAR